MTDRDEALRMAREELKRCGVCKTIKKFSDFHKHSGKGYLNGLDSQCKVCRQIYDAKRRAHPDEWKPNWHYVAERKKRDPEKMRVKWLVAAALRDGRIIRQPCFCGSDKAEAHHENYDNPLDVMWLCRKHHIEQHKKSGTWGAGFLIGMKKERKDGFSTAVSP